MRLACHTTPNTTIAADWSAKSELWSYGAMRGNDTIWSIASNNDAATAAGPTVRFHLLRELVGVSFELREARVPVQHLVHGWRPRPRRHGGFRRADDLLAWLQRRLRAVDHERPLLPPFYPYRDQRRLFNLYWFFRLQLKLKPPIRNRQCACNRQPPPTPAEERPSWP